MEELGAPVVTGPLHYQRYSSEGVFGVRPKSVVPDSMVDGSPSKSSKIGRHNKCDRFSKSKAASPNGSSASKMGGINGGIYCFEECCYPAGGESPGHAGEVLVGANCHIMGPSPKGLIVKLSPNKNEAHPLFVTSIKADHACGGPGLQPRVTLGGPNSNLDGYLKCSGNYGVGTAPSTPVSNLVAPRFGSKNILQIPPSVVHDELSKLKYSSGGIIMEQSDRRNQLIDKMVNHPRVESAASVKIIFRNLKADLKSANPNLIQESNMQAITSDTESYRVNLR